MPPSSFRRPPFRIPGFRALGFRGLGLWDLGFRRLGFRGLGFRGLGLRGGRSAETSQHYRVPGVVVLHDKIPRRINAVINYRGFLEAPEIKANLQEL